ncbi:TIGR02391 family protein [Pectinatus frisingensis]|uniref:TIGR02391 family protein n=1 Tax=Pectinatus frisingensis TaxID=865 RepID=UPI0018C6D011|nr:TIGR02391 family protein [Pectinatus frisingensis]
MNIIFNQQTIEEISKVLGNETTGSKITIMLENLGLYDELGSKDTKWKRIHNAVINNQNSIHSGKSLIDITEWIMNPVQYMTNQEKQEKYSSVINSLNGLFCFSGLSINDKGKISLAKKVSSHQEAIDKLKSLKKSLEPFNIHQRILAVCRPELLDENYFHLVFEAAKLVLNKVREISALNLDGNKLIDETFDGRNPRLVLNTLRTEDERSEHNALKSLLHFIVYFYRNPKAHNLKVYSLTKEQDAVIALCNISTALILLDKCQLNLSRRD